MHPIFTVITDRSVLAFELKPIRSVQSYVEISLFSLDEFGFPSAVNNTFLSFRVRDKSCHERGAQ
jgi:hypothetical protein